jgi:CDP-diglyceride synthetase
MENSYKKLAIALTINAVIMFLLNYVMISNWAYLLVNVNMVYMTVLMVLPMLVTMLTVMRSMFMNKRLNTALYVTAIGLFVLIFYFVRAQIPVGDKAFLRSMIPHHSSAILMCEQASLSDPEVVDLCAQIVPTQQEEINQMEQILDRLNQ